MLAYIYVTGRKDPDFVQNINDVDRAKENGARDGSRFADEICRATRDRWNLETEETEREFVLRNMQYLNKGDVWHWGSVAYMQRRAFKADVHGVYAEYYYRAFHSSAEARASDLIFSIGSA